MAQLSWRKAVLQVLEGSVEPMSSPSIAEAIVEQKLRSEFGATPSSTVATVITTSLNKDGEKSPFVRVSRGIYTLRSHKAGSGPAQLDAAADESAEGSAIGAFGMYWREPAFRGLPTHSSWVRNSPAALPSTSANSRACTCCTTVGQ